MLADSPTTARAKLQSAVTDSLPHVSYEPTSRPGVSNLISILSGLQDTPPQQLAGQFEGKSLKDLKDAVGDALEPLLIRFQNDFSRIRNETGFVKDVERKGREKATRKASETMEKVRTALGLEYEG